MSDVSILSLKNFRMNIKFIFLLCHSLGTKRKNLLKRGKKNHQFYCLNMKAIPVIVDKDPNCNLPDIEKQKFFVPSDLTFGHFLYVVRKRINVPAAETIFIFVNRKLPHSNVSMGSLYCSNKDSDGFLYCIYCSDSAYG